ncbi:MAG: hypothetical protein Q7U54_12395 [Bacteroidales bacterium]|nr:hypothetical protein [Bacteroidales bacterium]
MRIFLFGEYSGLHSNLRLGFKKLGHETLLLSSGDGHKQIFGDIQCGNNFKIKFFRNLFRALQFWLILPKIRNYDIVQFISYEFLVMPDILKVLYLKLLKYSNKKVIINRCGVDAIGIYRFLGNLRYSPLQNELKEGHFDSISKQIGYDKLKISFRLTSMFDGIIVNTYEYYIAHNQLNNFTGSIPLPIKLNAIFKPNVIINRIKILYGVLREDRKGHRYIQTALEDIRNRHSDAVEVIIVRDLPLQEYELLLEECNILIDQACSYSIGMNALYALSKGKVVLGGNEPEANTFFDFDVPVVNILPCSEDIIEKIEYFIKNINKIPEVGKLGYEYASTKHNADKIADQYIKYYKNIINA